MVHGMYFKTIRKTEHYKTFHENEVPWSDVVAVIFASSKQIRKKDDKLEIENDCYYILCELSGNVLWVINAKRK